MEFSINYIAVLVAAVIYYAIGAFWYSPLLFGNTWMTEVGLKKNEIQDGAGAKAYIGSFISALVMSFVMAHVVGAFGGNTLLMGIEGGVWTWLGFVATTSATNSFFAGRSVKLWFIDNGYHLVGLLVMGITHSLWL